MGEEAELRSTPRFPPTVAEPLCISFLDHKQLFVAILAYGLIGYSQRVECHPSNF